MRHMLGDTARKTVRSQSPTDSLNIINWPDNKQLRTKASHVGMSMSRNTVQLELNMGWPVGNCGFLECRFCMQAALDTKGARLWRPHGLPLISILQGCSAVQHGA